MGGIAPHSRRNWPNLAGLAGITFLFFLTISFLYDKQKSSPNETELSLSPFRRNRPPPRFNPERDGRKYGLSSSQCDAFFPGLFDEIHNAAVHRRAIGNVTRRELDIYSDHPFTLRAMIHSGNLYILEHKEILGSNWLEPRARAILHSIYRAVATSPEEIADAEFVMFFPDSVEYAVGTLGETGNDNITAKNSSFWSFSRREEHKNVWLMPDFGFWNWGKMGTLDSIKRKVSAVEQSMSFEDKTDRLLWRGRVWVAPETREPLMAATKTKEWADVVGLYGYEGFREKWVNPEDHCKWKYLLYAEGVAHSGRLKYLQACHSVIISPPISWQTPMRRLMQPSGPGQNYVEVSTNFSNLEEVMQHLRDNPAEAKRIADNSIRTFRDTYNSPGAEACYWRRLIREWSTISEAPALYAYEDQNEELESGASPADLRDETKLKWRGVPFEEFAVDWPRGD